MQTIDRLRAVHNELSRHLRLGIVPFWAKRGVDGAHGGYQTDFDANGAPRGDGTKYLVTQTRMIWGYAALLRSEDGNDAHSQALEQGLDFLLDSFWDELNGGWHWKTDRSGSVIDSGKLVYGHSFAIYALCEAYFATQEERALDYARDTFDLLQLHCTDTENGGYYENFEPDWRLAAPGFDGGDRKSLDIHMHLMEAFTSLAAATAHPTHLRKLREVADLVVERMVDTRAGCGLNQFDPAFRPIPAIDINRTWNAERETGETIETPVDSTSYGHNVELAWLANRAAVVLGEPKRYLASALRLVDHALRFGLDSEFGGVYRDGPHAGDPIVRDKEWWQNAEVLVGFLDAFEQTGDERYLGAFESTWAFNRTRFVNEELGEWRQLLSRDGSILVGDLGNPWKAFYHTGRSVLECISRIEALLEEELS